MNHITVKPRYVSVPVACLIAALLVPAVAHGGSYTIVSCDSAASFGFNASAWAPYGNAGRAYQQCPTSGGFTAGISNRLTDGVFSGFNHSGHAFTAPPGATLTKIRWAGRMVRNNCQWGTFILAVPSNTSVLGYRNGQLCDAKSFDNRSWPISVAVPAGTSRLEQLVICGASVCDAGATLHTQSVEVTVDDPVPPSISLSGPLASGQWVSGRTGQSPQVHVTASDNSGVQRIETALGGRNPSQAFACNWSLPRPCQEPATMSTGPGVADLSDGRHTLSVSALDAAGNPTSVTRDVYIDNTPPDPVLPEIVGGTAWRRANGFAASWTNPPNSGAPITR